MSSDNGPVPRRLTNLALLGLLAAAGGTGLLAYGVGTPAPSTVVTVLHGLAGLAILALVPWKQAIVRRGLARPAGRRGRGAGVALAVLVPLCIVAGVVHAVGGWRPYLGLLPLQVHVGAAVAILPFAVMHVVGRRQRPRRTDLSRRTAVRALGVGAAGAAILLAVEGAAALAGRARLGGGRRETGSHEVGSGEPARMPVTNWFLDPVPAVDARTWRLRVDGRALDAGALDRGDEVTATLDCTGGWYARQTWSGVRLDRLLPDLAADVSVDVVSVTGYRRRFPARDATHLLLATRVGGAPLSRGHGFPARLVAPGRRGFWWVKWVERVEVVDEPWWWQPPVPPT
jgi:DMSO/TMAO reductase YedYZ molybdopterin-dependent catalytic subunit